MRNDLVRPRRKLVLVATAVVVAIAVPTYAIAGHEESNVKSYTGCLSLNTGQISAVAQGDAPKFACSGTQVPIHLAGGDMTATRTPATGGLTGGGENGAASLGLQQSYKLPQGCFVDQVPKWNGGTNSWGCGSDNNAGGDITAVRTPSGSGLQGGVESGDANLGLEAGYKLPQGCANGQVAKSSGGVWNCGADNDTTYDGTDFARSNQGCTSGQFATGVNGTGNLSCAAPPAPGSVKGYTTGYQFQPQVEVAQSGQPKNVVASLSLPAGTYMVSATLGFDNVANFVLQNNTRTVLCGINDPGPFTGFSADIPGATATTMSISRVITLGAAGNAEVNCRVFGGGTDRSFVITRDFDITAVKLDSLN